jgi:hypothetical protein
VSMPPQNSEGESTEKLNRISEQALIRPGRILPDARVPEEESDAGYRCGAAPASLRNVEEQGKVRCTEAMARGQRPLSLSSGRDDKADVHAASA